MIQRIKSYIARLLAPGYGWCLCCKMPWKYVKYHVTHFDTRSGCFPLCVKCWGQLTPMTRLPYYLQLWKDWQDSADKYGEKFRPDPNDWSLIRDAVLQGK